jgi:hypothetical protein
VSSGLSLGVLEVVFRWKDDAIYRAAGNYSGIVNVTLGTKSGRELALQVLFPSISIPSFSTRLFKRN